MIRFAEGGQLLFGEPSVRKANYVHSLEVQATGSQAWTPPVSPVWCLRPPQRRSRVLWSLQAKGMVGGGRQGPRIPSWRRSGGKAAADQPGRAAPLPPLPRPLSPAQAVPPCQQPPAILPFPLCRPAWQPTRTLRWERWGWATAKRPKARRGPGPQPGKKQMLLGALTPAGHVPASQPTTPCPL